MRFEISFCWNSILRGKCLVARIVQSTHLIYLSIILKLFPLYLTRFLNNFVARGHLRLCIKFFCFRLGIDRCHQLKNLVRIF